MTWATTGVDGSFERQPYVLVSSGMVRRVKNLATIWSSDVHHRCRFRYVRHHNLLCCHRAHLHMHSGKQTLSSIFRSILYGNIGNKRKGKAAKKGGTVDEVLIRWPPYNRLSRGHASCMGIRTHRRGVSTVPLSQSMCIRLGRRMRPYRY